MHRCVYSKFRTIGDHVLRSKLTRYNLNLFADASRLSVATLNFYPTNEFLVTYLRKSRHFNSSYKCVDSKNIASGFCTKAGPQPDSTSTATETETVNIIFVTADGEEIKVKAKIGDNVLKLAKAHSIDCEGACDGTLACTTCHMYIDEKYEQFTGEPCLQEEDLLDCAPFLKPNSRLTCQIDITKEMDGMRLVLPKATLNFYVDGHQPTGH